MGKRLKSDVKDHKIHHYRFRLNDAEEAQFTKMYEQSGAPTKTKFILARIFG